MAGHDHASALAAFGVCPTCEQRGDRGGKPTCSFCGDELDPLGANVVRKVTGYVENRTSGGAHAIALREEHHVYAHALCIQAAKIGAAHEQVSLYG